MFEFGEKTRKRFYLLDETIHFTNHGSYGAVPKPIQNKRIELLQEMEKAPDAWFRVKSFKLWNSNRQSLASFLNVDSENIVLTENATDAINSVLKATTERLTKNDAILAHEYTYAAVLNAIDYVAKYRFAINDQINVLKVPCKYPINSIDEVLNAYDSMCEKIIVENKLILSLVVLDHISSATATLFPVEEIIKIIRKWEGVQERNETYSLKPNIISHGYGKEATKNFFERATRDSTSWYLIDDCIKIYENEFGGLNTITKYTSKLLEEAVEMLVSSWGTNRLELPKELEAPFMKVIKLPRFKPLEVLQSLSIEHYPPGLSNYLQDTFDVDAQITIINKEFYCRISCFVYNRIEDYISLRNAINELKQ